jgi:Cu/Ag efflux pump CusA
VDKAIATVKKNLLEGAILVIVILFLFLATSARRDHRHGDPAVDAVHLHGHGEPKVSANLMSLGAGLRHHHRRRGGDRRELCAAWPMRRSTRADR